MRITTPIILFLLPVLAAVALVGCGASDPLAIEDVRVREGRTLYDRAEFDRAERHFQALRDEAASHDDVLLEAQAEKWLGSIRLAYDLPDEALVHYQRSLVLLEGRIHAADSLGMPVDTRLHDERQNVWSNVAVVYKSIGRYDDAVAVFRQVLAHDSARADGFRMAVSLYNLGDVYHQHAVTRMNVGDTAAARSLKHESRALYLRSLARHETADAWMNLGNSYALDAGVATLAADRSDPMLDSAVACYRRAEGMYARDGFRVHRALALGNIGVIERSQNRADVAARALEQSIDIIEELRGDLSSVDVRTSFVTNKFYIYESLISLLVERNDIARAFEFVERAKARSFLDMLGNKAVGEGKERPAAVRELVAREQDLQRRISEIVGNTDSSAVLGDLIVAHQRTLTELREKDPEYASVKSIDPVPVQRLQELLDDTTAVLEYFIGEFDAFVFLVRRDSIAVQPITVFEEHFNIDDQVEQLRRTLYYDFPMRKLGFLRERRLGAGLGSAEALRAWRAEPTDPMWQTGLIEMYSRLFVPVRDGLDGIRQLYIVPHGPLHHLPFQALLAPQHMDIDAQAHMQRPRFLIEEYAIAYLPSASVLSFALRKNLSRASLALVVGDPVYADPKYRRRPLDGALVEADTVASYAAHALVLKREEAEEQVVKSVAGAMDLLHFATHGELNKEDPMQSRILLAAAEPDSINNGDLTVAKIFNLDLNAVLVTLSACQTAQLAGETGSVSLGDDLVGLTRSFMYAGTPSVVASLWVVDDAATLAWMRAFYDAWLHDGQSKMQAARRAALAMLSQTGDPDWVFPYFWAAFVYLGDAR
ncbi:MAG: CHAT domain-containing tetratricopeptide repeat protein [Bacteroidota bacterium]|jgi:CHAT domain-containing protein/tetratricopeptide (TPR) repeat protein|nr:CHAT domain-containing tetratricopeptide repeat protein [Bacteroidota bacterium]